MAVVSAYLQSPKWSSFMLLQTTLKEIGELLSHILERQITYFVESDALEGVLAYLVDSPWVQGFKVVREGFDKENPRIPFRLW